MPRGARLPDIRLPDVSPFGPIFGKELRATARRKRSYALRVLYLGALLLALLVAWSTTSNQVYFNSVAAQAQAQAQMGQMFFAFFCVFSATAMAVLGPVLTSTAISAERLGKTLHVLLMTPVTAWQIIAGKLFSRLLVALTLIGLSLPALALVRLLGGVELGQMVGIVCLCVATVMATASIGLLLSTFMNRAYAVILLSYAVMLLLYVFVPFVLYFGFALGGGAYGWVYDWINWMTCAITLAEPRGSPGVGDWLPCVLVHLGLSAVLVAASAVVLRRTSRRAGDGRLSAAPAEAASTPADEAMPVTPPPLAPPSEKAPAVRPVAPAREVSDQPVLWRETRRPLMAKPWQAVVGAAATVLLLVVTYFVLWGDHLLDEEMSQAGYAWIFNLIVWLLTAVLAATAIAQEKESDTWTLLLTTPLTGRAIVWGKVLGVYKRLLWPAALIVTHFVAFTVFGVIPWQALVVTLWVIFTFNSIWVATGIFLSLRHRKVTVAVIVNLLLAVGIYLIAFFVLLTVGETAGVHDLQELVAWYLPYFYLADAVTATWSHTPEALYLPGNLRVSSETFLAVVFTVGVVHLGVAYGILRVTAGTFDRIVGRASQGRHVGPVPAAAGA
jgi:ABC-type transport system involved in multi-copper enzyme maturation permease subunit